MVVPTAPVRVHSQRPLAPSQSRLSANDKGDNEMMPRAVHRSPDTYLKGEQNKGEHLLGGYTTRHRLKWGFLPPNEVGRIAKHVRKGEGRKDGKGTFSIRFINKVILFMSSHAIYYIWP